MSAIIINIGKNINIGIYKQYECLIEETIGNMGSFKTGGRKISTIKYADELALIT